MVVCKGINIHYVQYGNDLFLGLSIEKEIVKKSVNDIKTFVKSDLYFK